MIKKIDKEAQVLGVSFFSRSKSDLLKELIVKGLHSRETTYIFTPNPEQLVLAESEPGFKKSLQQAEIRIPDGAGVVWASQILSRRQKSLALSHRIGGVDLVIDLLKQAQVQQWRTLLIGGKNYGRGEQPLLLTVNAAATQIYWLSGYENVDQPTQEEERRVMAVIEQLKPDVLLVAFGAPSQEYWALRHRTVLEKLGVKIVMVVGGSFDYLLNQVSRAPQWLQNLGFEWLFRLIRQPWRWKRQLRLFKFIWLVFKELVS